MSEERFDATNAVRLCQSCELESGVSAGADAGDRACSVCGRHDAPFIYPALTELDEARVALRELFKAVQEYRVSQSEGDLLHEWKAVLVAHDAARAALSQPSEGE